METLHTIALSILLPLSSFLGVSDVPNQSLGKWEIARRWESDRGRYVFEATSDSLLSLCKTNPTGIIQFPSVIHSAHELFQGKRKVFSYGDPTFETVRSFYGAPSVSCLEIDLAQGPLTWRIYAYSRYFARFAKFPWVTSNGSLLNFFNESLNLLAAGALFVMALFTGVVFWGKVPRPLTLSLALSNLFSSVYFFGAVAEYAGLRAPMLQMHKISDTGIWFGLALFFNALRIQGLLTNKLYYIFLGHVVIALAGIMVGTTGDSIQLGTTVPFGMTVFICVFCLYRLSLLVRKRGFTRNSLFAFLSMAFFLAFLMNDIFVVTGLSGNYVILSLGFVSGLLFFGLSVNEQIVQIYDERDYLRLNLEKEVVKKTADLQLAMNNLKEAQAERIHTAKLASLGTLSAGIAHEINNSLNYVYGSLRPVEKMVATLPDELTRSNGLNLIKVMNDGLKLTFEIIKSLKNYTGLNQAKFNDVVLQEVFQSVLTILQSRIKDRIIVKINVAPGLSAHGNVVGLNQIFMNLVSNALDAMGESGELQITALETPKGIQVSVADTGIGMPPEVQQRIFEPFFTTKDVGKGTGLGLYIAKMEIENHHGSISVKSTEGKGTEFVVILPTSSHSQIPAKAAA